MDILVRLYNAGKFNSHGLTAQGADSPSPNGFGPRTSVVLPISQLFGKVRSFGAEEWADSRRCDPGDALVDGLRPVRPL